MAVATAGHDNGARRVLVVRDRPAEPLGQLGAAQLAAEVEAACPPAAVRDSAGSD